MKEDELITTRELRLALVVVRSNLLYEINALDAGDDLKPTCYNAKKALEKGLLVVNKFIKQEEEED